MRKMDLFRAILKVREAVGEVLDNDEKKFDRFMETKQAGLEGLSPMDYLNANGKEGLARVLDFIEGSKSGEMA